MKIVEEKKMVEVVEKKYVAMDGTIFSDEENCKKWEESYKGIITAMFEQKIHKMEISPISLGIPYASEDNEAFLIEVHSIDEATIVNAYLDLYDNYYKGKVLPLNTPLMIMFGWDRDWVDVYDLKAELDRLVKHHNEILDLYKKEEEEKQ